MKAATLGAGAWGTALAVMLARKGHSVTLTGHRAEFLSRMRISRENRDYLPGVGLPDSLALEPDWAAAVSEANLVVMAVPSRYARAATSPIAAAIPKGATIVSAAKGIEEDSLMTMTAMLAGCVPHAGTFVALSGPGFAAEVARGKPAAIVAASANGDAARQVQHLFSSRSLRIYTSSDVIGVELAGAAKNVIAIAAGISDALKLGSSARAAVVTRGLAELARLVEAAGGRRETVMGLSGLGDLVLTCTGELSRNRALGIEIGRRALIGEQIVAPHPSGGPVAEGFTNARSVKQLADRYGIEMPIVAAVYRALYEGAHPKAMVEELLSRELKAEF